SMRNSDKVAERKDANLTEGASALRHNVDIAGVLEQGEPVAPFFNNHTLALRNRLVAELESLRITVAELNEKIEKLEAEKADAGAAVAAISAAIDRLR